MRVYYSTPPTYIPRSTAMITRFVAYVAALAGSPFSPASPASSVCHSSRPRGLRVTSFKCSTPQQPAMQQHKGE